jgi:hypothetical protein
VDDKPIEVVVDPNLPAGSGLVPRGRLKPGGKIYGHAARRLADVAPHLPPARPEDYWPASEEDLAEWQRRWEQANANAPAHMKRVMRRADWRRLLWSALVLAAIVAVALSPLGNWRLP